MFICSAHSAFPTETSPAALSPRLQSLLAYLLIHRAAPQTRQQIAFLFWPETSDAQAQTNLRQLLHTLKRRFPNPEAYLRVDERTVGWRADAAYSLDVAIFENALGRAALAQGPAKIAGLEQAVAAYAGDLMPGCYDDWILPVRERLAQAYVGAMEQLVLLHEERRNHASAIAHAQQLLRYDPLHEATYRRLMRLYALTGDRAAALRVYHTCASALERELDVAPSPATQEVYERLRQVDGGPGPTPVRPHALCGPSGRVGDAANPVAHGQPGRSAGGLRAGRGRVGQDAPGRGAVALGGAAGDQNPAQPGLRGRGGAGLCARGGMAAQRDPSAGSGPPGPGLAQGVGPPAPRTAGRRPWLACARTPDRTGTASAAL